SSQTTARRAGSASRRKWLAIGEPASAASPRSWTTALTNDTPSEANETPSTTNAQVAGPPSPGATSDSIPWYAENPAPSTKIPIAASREQKKRSLPYPEGCLLSAGLRLRRNAAIRNTWFMVSPTEWAASDSIAEEP